MALTSSVFPRAGALGFVAIVLSSCDAALTEPVSTAAPAAEPQEPAFVVAQREPEPEPTPAPVVATTNDGWWSPESDAPTGDAGESVPLEPEEDTIESVSSAAQPIESSPSERTTAQPVIEEPVIDEPAAEESVTDDSLPTGRIESSTADAPDALRVAPVVAAEPEPVVTPDVAVEPTSEPEPATEVAAQAPLDVVAESPAPVESVPADTISSEPDALVPAGLESALEVNAPSTGSDLWAALFGGTAKLDLRYRLENVDDDALAKEANASTLRTRLAYTTAPYGNLQGTLEFEAVSSLGTEFYNSTVNGVTDRPVVADPVGAEINQVYVDYTGVENLRVRLGRQRINRANQRFVGSVGWRQNDQTLDALSATWSRDGLSIDYALVGNANRIFGDDSAVGDERMATHLLDATYALDGSSITGYWYHIDAEQLLAFSTSTVGLRFTGSSSVGESSEFDLTADFAFQNDTGDNPNEVDASYLGAELGYATSGLRFAVGIEQLGGSGDPGDSFKTPLATLHKFNGWADRFLVTPDDGLVDLYASIGGPLGGGSWKAIWHQFEADNGSSDYGTELDLLFKKPINENVAIGAKAAIYDADEFSTDVQKFWFWVSITP